MQPKYRLGKKQKRAILEVATGHEYLVFPHGKTENVAEFLEWLNLKYGEGVNDSAANQVTNIN